MYLLSLWLDRTHIFSSYIIGELKLILGEFFNKNLHYWQFAPKINTVSDILQLVFRLPGICLQRYLCFCFFTAVKMKKFSEIIKKFVGQYTKFACFYSPSSLVTRTVRLRQNNPTCHWLKNISWLWRAQLPTYILYQFSFLLEDNIIHPVIKHFQGNFT